MNKILKEPLLHFLLIGAALFILFNQFSGAESRQDTIVIDDSDIDRMMSTWQMQWQRPPTQKELNGLVSQHLKQEVYYREALKMQLDHNDEIVKRRLYQKLEFLMDDIAEMDEPTEEEIKEYYKEHIDKYLHPPQISLTSIYFNPDKREDARADALKALSELPKEPTYATVEEFGDVSFVPALFEKIDANKLGQTMGLDFAESVFDLETGSWQGPLLSGYGVHLVYITDKIDSEEGAWEEVRRRVLIDFSYDRQIDYGEAVYKELQKHYKVVFDFDEDVEIDQE